LVTTLYIDGQKLDQFKDETIEVVSSVLDIKDITKNSTDYSKSFTVPASKQNNIIFSHWYDFNIDNSFDATRKVDGEIHLDGIPFKKGKWRLQKVNVKKGKPDSYSINFFGHLVGIKDVAADRLINTLDLSAFDHDYDSDTVKTGLTSSLFSGNVIYNLLVKKQYYINNIPTDLTETDALSNISWTNGNGTNGITWSDLRPSIKLIKIIEAIEQPIATQIPGSPYVNGGLGITFSRDFFGTSEFQGLYLWMNNDVEEIRNSHIIDWDGGNSTYINHTTDLGTYQVWNTPSSGDRVIYKLYLNITPEPAFMDVDYTIRYYVDDEVAFEVIDKNRIYNSGSDTPLLISADDLTTFTIYFEIETGQEFQYTATLTQDKWVGGSFDSRVETTASANTLTGSFNIEKNLPELKIIDFLKGLFQMYRLVIIPTGENEYYVNTVEGYYSEGANYDITKYIDWNSYDVERGDMLNQIKFKFSDPQTILNIQYKKINGVGYGDEDLRIYVDQNNPTELIDGDSLTVELPFEQIVYEHLVNQENGEYTTTQYGAIIDEDLEPANPKAHIFYSALAPVSGYRLGFINDAGVKVILDTFINVPIHSDIFSTQSQYSTTFAANINEWNQTYMNSNLYTNHYKDYIEAIFNVKKRTTKHTAYLPLHIITKLALNDILYIKGNYYRMDNYTYNLLTGEAKLELVNTFDNTLNPFRSNTGSVYTDFRAKTENVSVTNLTGATPTKVDAGFGTSWAIVSIVEPNILEVIFEENNTGSERDMFISLSAVDSKETSIYINQSGTVLTFDFSNADASQYIPLLMLRS
jgi:hypothetical protein